jgi:Helix-turn-helix domain
VLTRTISVLSSSMVASGFIDSIEDTVEVSPWRDLNYLVSLIGDAYAYTAYRGMVYCYVVRAVKSSPSTRQRRVSLEYGNMTNGNAAPAVESSTQRRRVVPEQEYYTPPQAAHILQISRRRVTQMLNTGVLQGEQLENGRWRITAAAVTALLKERASRQASRREKSSSDETLKYLGDRVSVLENRLERQADSLNRALNYAERMEEELRSRIRELEEELNGRAR